MAFVILALLLALSAWGCLIAAGVVALRPVIGLAWALAAAAGLQILLCIILLSLPRMLERRAPPPPAPSGAEAMATAFGAVLTSLSRDRTASRRILGGALALLGILLAVGSSKPPGAPHTTPEDGA